MTVKTIFILCVQMNDYCVLLSSKGTVTYVVYNNSINNAEL